MTKDKEIEEFFDKKMKEFETILRNNAEVERPRSLSKARLRGNNREKVKKIDEIQGKMREAELDKLQKAFCEFEEGCKQKLKNFVDRSLKKYQGLKVIEDQRYKIEVKSARKQQKQLIIDNIRKYYDDKIQIFKEKIQERRVSRALNDYEHKVVFSEARKVRRQQHQLSHEHSVALIKQKIMTIKQEMEYQEHSIQSKILQLYKRSTKSLKKF